MKAQNDKGFVILTYLVILSDSEVSIQNREQIAEFSNNPKRQKINFSRIYPNSSKFSAFVGKFSLFLRVLKSVKVSKPDLPRL